LDSVDADADRGGAGAVQRSGEDVGELGRRTLEADRSGVGDVVADGVQPFAAAFRPLKPC
jgi:hypothetical protein